MAIGERAEILARLPMVKFAVRATVPGLLMPSGVGRVREVSHGGVWVALVEFGDLLEDFGLFDSAWMGAMDITHYKLKGD